MRRTLRYACCLQSHGRCRSLARCRSRPLGQPIMPAPRRAKETPLGPRKTLAALAYELGAEMMERLKAAPPRAFSSTTREELLRAHQERRRAADERELRYRREYSKARYAREKARKAGLPVPPPPETPFKRRKREAAEAEDAKRQVFMEGLKALREERLSVQHLALEPRECPHLRLSVARCRFRQHHPYLFISSIWFASATTANPGTASSKRR